MGHHIFQIHEIDDPLLCPVLALKKLLQSRPLLPTFLFFASKDFPHHPVIDTNIRNALETVVTLLKIEQRDHGFHSFCRSGATLAFDCQVPLQNIMAHGLWKSVDLPTKCYHCSLGNPFYFRL